MELALLRSDLGDVDVEEACGVALEGLFGLSPSTSRSRHDAMPLQASMQRRARQVRDGCLQCIEAVVERQQRMLRKATTAASSSAVSTVERTSFGPIGAS